MNNQYARKKIGYLTTAITVWLVIVASMVGLPYIATGMMENNKVMIAIGLFPFFLNIVIFTIWFRLTRDPKLKILRE